MLRLQYVAPAVVAATIVCGLTAAAQERPRVYTNQQYIEDVTRNTALPLDDPKAMLAFILESLPDRVKVYPTENYYYFYFYHNGVRYGGNIRLDKGDRDEGKLHFAYFPELTEWHDENKVEYRLFGKEDGVLIERIEPFLYRVRVGKRSVEFVLNDLSNVTPPPSALGPDDQFLGPILDESGISFFLVFNKRLKIFHYVLNEAGGVPDQLLPSRLADRILIGRRTGFAFYDEHKLKRKILIGVYETNADVNNQFDGPFDQLPDNFIKGNELRDAIVAVEPDLADKIDRFGGDPGGDSRYLIGPYIYYFDEEDLLPIHQCASNAEIPAHLYHACFVIRDDRGADEEDGAESEPAKPAPNKAVPDRSVPSLQR
jgi:hypothetical protein